MKYFLFYYVEGKFFVKRCAVHLDRSALQSACFEENIMNIRSDVVPGYFFSVVNMARFQIMHV